MLVIDFTNRPLIYNAEKTFSIITLLEIYLKIKHLRYMQYFDSICTYVLTKQLFLNHERVGPILIDTQKQSITNSNYTIHLPMLIPYL